MRALAMSTCGVRIATPWRAHRSRGRAELQHEIQVVDHQVRIRHVVPRAGTGERSICRNRARRVGGGRPYRPVEPLHVSHLEHRACGRAPPRALPPRDRVGERLLHEEGDTALQHPFRRPRARASGPHRDASRAPATPRGPGRRVSSCFATSAAHGILVVDPGKDTPAMRRSSRADGSRARCR